MVHKSSNHPHGIHATLDALFAFVVTMTAISLAGRHQFAPLGLKHLLNSQITVINAIFALAFLFSWRYCFSILGLYRSELMATSRKVVLIARGCLLMTLLLGIFMRISQPQWPVLTTIVTFFALSFCYELSRVIGGAWLRQHLASRDPRRVVILGSGRRAGKAWRAVRTHYRKEVAFLGFVDNRSCTEMAPDIADRYLGRFDQLSELLLRDVIDIIVIAMPAKSCYEMIQQTIELAEHVGVSVVYLNDIFATSRRYDEPEIEGIFDELVPLKHQFILGQTIKRAIDVIGAAGGLILFAPLMAIIAVAIKATDPGDVMFRQERFGYKRRRFQILKFRSMVMDAPQRMAALESENEAAGPIFKMKNDPRITPLGKLLRATSLDELPQLWNVLVGDMSLVGPRPMSVRDVTLFDNASLMRRFSVKPGITGLWQVSGRSSIGFDQWMALDFRYIDRWSLALDLNILLRTFSAVLKRSGAM